MALRLKANRRFPSVPVVIDTTENHTQVLMAVKEALDIGQRRTGDLLNSFIRVEDLIDLGLITIEGNTNAIVGADLSQIANIGDLTSAAIGDFLRYDGTEWVNAQLATSDITTSMVTQHQAALSIAYSQITGAPSIPATLNDLTDVTISSPTLGDVLTYNGTQWVDSPPVAAGFLDDLLDVDAPYPIAGDFLVWDGYAWVSQSQSYDDLDALIMADTPTAYWKCTEASGNFLDSSGHGNTLTAAGTIDYRAVALMPSRPNERHAFLRASAGASVAGAIGTSPPLVGDYTIEGICLVGSANAATIFGLGGNGESTATNFQALVGANSATGLNTFWENSAAGTNVTTLGPPIIGVPTHVVCVKDGTANTITWYVNGRFAGIVAYVLEPTGGTTVTTAIGAQAGNPSDAIGLAHVAFYNGQKLSADKVKLRAIAAGLYQHP